MRLLFLQKTRAAEALYLGWITQSKGFPAASIRGLLELWFHYISNSKLFNMHDGHKTLDTSVRHFLHLLNVKQVKLPQTPIARGQLWFAPGKRAFGETC